MYFFQKGVLILTTPFSSPKFSNVILVMRYDGGRLDIFEGSLRKMGSMSPSPLNNQQVSLLD